MDPADRIRMLESFIDANPTDPFPRYSLALECMNNAGERERAGALFAALVDEAPDYVPTYLMYGNFLTRDGDLPLAREIFARGIEVARAASDGHAASELGAALAELGDSA